MTFALNFWHLVAAIFKSSYILLCSSTLPHDSGEGFAILLLKTSCIKTQVCLDDECQEAAAARKAGFASQASQF